MGSKVVTPKQGPPDFILTLVTLVLLALGLVMVLSASVGYLVGNLDSPEKADIFKYGKQQVLWAVFGLAVMFAFTKVHYRFWKKIAPILMLIGILTLLLVFIPALGGTTIRDSTRWLDLRFMLYQPSEGIKMVLAIYLAAILSEVGFKSPRGIILSLGALVVCVALVMKQPDLGTTFIIALTAVCMFFAAGLDPKFLAGLVAFGGTAAASLIVVTGYGMKRIQVWLDPWKYVSGDGYQTVNAFLAMGSGGILGVGLGQGMQKYGHVPENYTDMIFATVGEELGLIGTGLVILLFAIFVWRGLTIASRVKDPFPRYLAVGITSMIGFQAFINMSVVTGLLPVTGVTLPFISYGGSSLTIKLASVGILLNISRHVNSNTGLTQ